MGFFLTSEFNKTALEDPSSGISCARVCRTSGNFWTCRTNGKIFGLSTAASPGVGFWEAGNDVGKAGHYSPSSPSSAQHLGFAIFSLKFPPEIKILFSSVRNLNFDFFTWAMLQWKVDYFCWSCLNAQRSVFIFFFFFTGNASAV